VIRHKLFKNSANQFKRINQLTINHGTGRSQCRTRKVHRDGNATARSRQAARAAVTQGAINDKNKQRIETFSISSRPPMIHLPEVCTLINAGVNCWALGDKMAPVATWLHTAAYLADAAAYKTKDWQSSKAGNVSPQQAQAQQARHN
jgi:Tfp pilus assembly major pilin PilA